MSQQEQNSKKELSEKELEQAAGGAVIAPANYSVTPWGDPVPMWIDADGVRHPGERPGATTPPFSGDPDDSSTA